MERKVCDNPDCKAENPIQAKFCAKCGTRFSINLPFHLRRPELNLVPYSAFRQKPCDENDLIRFWDILSLHSGYPEYVENLKYRGDTLYLFAAKHDRVGMPSDLRSRWHPPRSRNGFPTKWLPSVRHAGTHG